MIRDSIIRITSPLARKNNIEDRFNSLFIKMGISKYGSGADLKLQALEIGLSHLEKSHLTHCTQTNLQENSKQEKILFINELLSSLKEENFTNPTAFSFKNIMHLFIESKNSKVFGFDQYYRTQINWLFKFLQENDIYVLDIRGCSKNFKDLYLIHRESPYFLQLRNFIFKVKIHPKFPRSTQSPQLFYDKMYRIMNITHRVDLELNLFEEWIINKILLEKGIIKETDVIPTGNEHIYQEIWDLNLKGDSTNAKKLLSKLYTNTN